MTQSKHSFGLWVAASLALAAAVPAAHAQAPTPGDIEAPFRERPRPPAGTLPEDGLPAAPARPTVAPGGRKVTVERFDVAGNQLLGDDAIAEVLAPWRGRDLTLLEIYDAADAISRRYRELGYALASATVPAQKVTDGVVRIEVLEGRIGGVRFSGNQRYDDAFLDHHVDEIAVGQRLRLDALERELLLLNDMPGLKARSVIEPGKEFGTSNIVIKTEETPVSGSVGINNYGRESAGEWRVDGTVDVNNPLGLGDVLGLQLVHGEGGLLNFYASVSYSLPVDTSGTRAGASFARFVYDVDERDVGLAPALGLRGDGTSARVQLTRPIHRSRARNTLVGVGFNRSDTTSSRAGPDQREHIAFADASILSSWRHGDGSSTVASAVVSTNFRQFKVDGNGNENGGHRGKLEIEGTHQRPLADRWSLYARARGALSIDPLANTERFRIGGPFDVRGYPSAELAGDRGVQLTLEARRFFQLQPDTPAQWRVYWDGGVVWRKDGAVDVKTGAAEERASLTSIGTGISVSLPRASTATLDLVIPTHAYSASDERDDARVWASVGTRF